MKHIRLLILFSVAAVISFGFYTKSALAASSHCWINKVWESGDSVGIDAGAQCSGYGCHLMTGQVSVSFGDGHSCGTGHVWGGTSIGCSNSYSSSGNYTITNYCTFNFYDERGFPYLVKQESKRQTVNFYADVPTPTPTPTPTCDCGNWISRDCGIYGCSSTQRNQYRTCTPSQCSATLRCIDDPSCSQPGASPGPLPSTPPAGVGVLYGECRGTSSAPYVALWWTSDSRANSNGLQKGIEGSWYFLPTTYDMRKYNDYDISPGVTYSYRVKYTTELPSNVVTLTCGNQLPTGTIDILNANGRRITSAGQAVGTISGTSSDPDGIVSNVKIAIRDITLSGSGCYDWNGSGWTTTCTGLNVSFLSVDGGRWNYSRGPPLSQLTNGHTYRVYLLVTDNLGANNGWNVSRDVVYTALNNARYISQSVPTTMQPGQQYSVSITMRNTGTTTWTRANNYRLGSQNPRDNTIWGTLRVFLAAGDSIAPGQQKTFTFNVTAPSALGTYNFQWRMVQEVVEWFGDFTPNVVISVVNNAPVVSNVRVVEPNYCTSGPMAFVSWSYSDADGNPQSAYQVQIDDNVAFSSPDVNTGKRSGGTKSYVSGAIAFNRTFFARVRVWDSLNSVSAWRTMTLCTGPGCAGNQQSWTTPRHAYPSNVNFTWTPPKPIANQEVVFSKDTTTCYRGAGVSIPTACTAYIWNFGDGTPTVVSPASTQTHSYSAEGTYSVQFSARDAQGYTCPVTPLTKPVSVQGQLPQWKEVLPQ